MRLSQDILGASLAVLLLGTAPAAADPPLAALQSYAAGQFLDAAEIAGSEPSPSSLAFSARALVAACIVRGDQDRIDALLDRAETAAAAALALDEESVDARLQWAIVLGVRGRRASLTQAVAGRYAPRGRELIGQALERAPDDPWAHALLGGWHLEVLRRGGRAGAIAYGARLDKGLEAFDRARALAPHDPLIALQYAVALLELDAERYAPRAAMLLAAATDAPANDAFERYAVRQAARIEAVLDMRGPEAARALIANLAI